MRAGGGASRSSQRCVARERRWSRIRGGVRAPTPGPELLRGTEPTGRHGALAGHPSAASRGGRGMGAPKVQATAPQLRPRGKLQDSEVHFRGDRSLASGSAFAPLLREPARWGGRKKEPRAASREPPACRGACARRLQLGPGKGKPDSMNAQAQGGGGAKRSWRALWACAESKCRSDCPKGRSL